MVMIHDELATSRIQVDALLEAIPDALCHVDSTGILLSYKSGIDVVRTQTLVGQNMLEVLPPPLSKQMSDAMQRAQETGEVQVCKYQTRIGGIDYIRESRIAPNSKDDFICLVRDVTEYNKIAQSLVENERRFRALTENASDLVLILDATGIYRYASPSHQKILGYTAEELLGTSIFNLFTTEDLPVALTSFTDSLTTNTMVRRKCRLRHVNGSVRTIEYVGRSCFDDPAIEGFVINGHDVTERTVMEKMLRYQVSHDTLTELPNRTTLLERLGQAITVAKQTQCNSEVALLTMDLNSFKEINDTFGHHHGDILLQQLGLRLRSVVTENDTVARLGGDEFALLLPSSDSMRVEQTIAAISAVLEEPFVIEELPLQVQASIGVALYPAHGSDALTILRHADVAMYTAKHAHLGHMLYDAAQDTYSPRRLALMGALRKAIANSELKLYYQPKVEISTGKVQSVEALVRWQHPEFGFIPPDQFIPLAEQTGLIIPLTLWVLETAARQCSEWLRAGLELSIAVNLSMWDLRELTLPNTIGALLKRYALPAHLLRVELTESVVMTDVERTLDILNRLSTLGIQISVDDFGTGYSSLAYLKRMPITELKIDRSFVMHMAEIEADATIVQSTVAMAHSLGLKVVAEGVEDEKTWCLLADFKCDTAQGYYMSRPISAQDLENWIRKTR